MRPTLCIWNPVSSKMVLRAWRVLASFVWMEWVTHSWHGSLSSDSSHWGTWACLLIWGSAHTKISLNLRASAGQEERGPLIRGAHLLQCSQRATELPRHQTQDYFADLRTMRAVPLWPPSTSPLMMTCLQKIFFLKKKIPSFKQNLLYKLLSFYDQVNRCVLLLNFVSWRETS